MKYYIVHRKNDIFLLTTDKSKAIKKQEEMAEHLYMEGYDDTRVYITTKKLE